MRIKTILASIGTITLGLIAFFLPMVLVPSVDAMREKNEKIERFQWCCDRLKQSGQYSKMDDIVCECNRIVETDYGEPCY